MLRFVRLDSLFSSRLLFERLQVFAVPRDGAHCRNHTQPSSFCLRLDPQQQQLEVTGSCSRDGLLSKPVLQQADFTGLVLGFRSPLGTQSLILTLCICNMLLAELAPLRSTRSTEDCLSQAFLQRYSRALHSLCPAK